MGIWKNRGGGYRSGGTEYEEYIKRHNKRPYGEPLSESEYTERYLKDGNDIQLVRLVERHELAAHLDSIGHYVDPDTIDAVLRGLLELTPDGKDKKAWTEIHRR